MQKTQNYNLNQWEATDKLSREDFNADNAAVDAAIKAVADGQATISQSVAALTTALGTGGQNCRIAWGSYTGTGTAGTNGKSSLTFAFKPMMVAVYDPTIATDVAIMWSEALNTPYKNKSCTVSWSGNSVTWHSDTSAYYQFNVSGTTYYYVVIGY